MRFLSGRAWSVIIACALLAALLYTCGARAATVAAGPPVGHHWPFTPKSARLLMLMDKGHATRSSDGRQLWALSATLTYRTHAGDTITAPKGMQTDLASIPAVIQGLLPSDGDYAQGALIHDFLFKTSGSCVWVWTGKLPNGKPFRKVDPKSCSRAKPYSRQEANQILDDAMVDLGVPTWRRWLIMDGLYVGSASGWGK